MNKIVLSGTLYGKLNQRESASGLKITRGVIKVYYKHEKTEKGKSFPTYQFFNFYIWGNKGEVLYKKILPNNKLVLTGELRCNVFVDKDNNKKQIYEIEVDDVDFIPNLKKEIILNNLRDNKIEEVKNNECS